MLLGLGAAYFVDHMLYRKPINPFMTYVPRQTDTAKYIFKNKEHLKKFFHIFPLKDPFLRLLI